MPGKRFPIFRVLVEVRELRAEVFEVKARDAGEALELARREYRPEVRAKAVGAVHSRRVTPVRVLLEEVEEKADAADE